MIEIHLDEILSYKPLKKSHSDYTYGGWYMIKNIKTGKSYVGKSIEYMFRLRQHVKMRNPKTFIDKCIKEDGMNSFKYYLILSYDSYGICFHNRGLESVIEHTLIKKHNTNYPTGYNKRYYEQLSIK